MNKNKKGFTIVEVVASVGLIMLLTVLVVSSIMKTSDDSKNKIYQSKITLALTKAEEYGRENIDDFTSECTIITIGDLIALDYLDEMIDPRTSEPMDNIRICIKYQNKRIITEIITEEVGE